MTAAGHRFRGLVLGAAGTGPAWALMAVALLSVLVAIAGPRELTVVQARALQTALSQVPALDSGVAAAAQWQQRPGGGELLPTDIDELQTSLGAAMQGIPAAPSQHWAAVTPPIQTVRNPARAAILSSAPTMEVVYRSGLSAHARLVSGALPDAVAPGPARRSASQIFDVAVTTATAARFALRIGSRVDLGALLGNSAAVALRVTGIVRPVDPGSAFWQADPTLAAPVIPKPGHEQIWSGGTFVGRDELVPLERAYSGSVIQAQWYFPLDFRTVTPAELPHVLARLSALAAANGGPQIQTALPAGSQTSLVVSSSFGTAISGFLAQQQAAGALDSLLIADVLIADLLVIFACAALVVDAYRPELALIRARGGATTQVAGRVLARAACLAVPAGMLGAGLAVTAVPATPGDGTAPWALGGLAAAAAIASPALIAAWTYRRARPRTVARADLATLRPAARRSVGELTILIAAGAALAAARLSGTGPETGTYTRAAPVLVAAAAALIAARLYPVPLRPLLRVAAGRPGATGFLGLARAARTRIGALLPAVALVLSLTLATFGTMVVSSITRGQTAAAWQQVGADVMIEASGNATVSPAALRAVGAVRGVRRGAAAYITPDHGVFAGVLRISGGGSQPVGLVLASPAQYAALARQTPWPRFPAGALARGTGPTVPVLASTQLGVAAGSGTLELAGIRLPVRVTGTIATTPAKPGGGTFVVLPAWATPRFPSIPGPDTLLATGTAIDLPALRAAVRAAMPGAQVLSRAQVLGGLESSPAPQAAARLYELEIWVAVLLSVVSLLFGLAVSARSRAQLIERLTALGVSSRQARAVAISDILPLLSVAVLGTLVAGSVLAEAIGPVLNLAVFTGSADTVPVRPAPGMLLPAAGIIILAVGIVAVQATAFLRQNVAAALRREEAG